MKNYPQLPTLPEEISYEEYMAFRHLRGIFETERKNELCVLGDITQIFCDVKFVVKEKLMADFYPQDGLHERQWRVRVSNDGENFMTIKICRSKEEALETLEALAETIRNS